MTRQIEGLWVGGAISVAAAEFVEAAIRNQMDNGCIFHLTGPQRVEIANLANAIRADIQKLPEPPKPDPLRYL